MFYPPPTDRPPISFLSPEALKKKIIISDKPPGDSVVTQVALEEPYSGVPRLRSLLLSDFCPDAEVPIIESRAGYRGT
jgi:hypothetical protein